MILNLLEMPICSECYFAFILNTWKSKSLEKDELLIIYKSIKNLPYIFFSVIITL